MKYCVGLKGLLSTLDFDLKLKFNCHITNIVKKSNNLLDFHRNCTDFNDQLALKSIYCCLISSICK